MREWNQEDLTRVCAEWQYVLGLSEWEIAIRFGRHWAVSEECMGDVTYVTSKRQAIITVLDP
jgi:hypothetical protein